MAEIGNIVRATGGYGAGGGGGRGLSVGGFGGGASAPGAAPSVGAPASGGSGDAVIRKAIADALAAQSAAAAPSAAGPTTNTAAPNPVSNAVVSKLMARAEGDMGAPAAFDRGIQDIRARADMGIAQGQELNRAMRGVSGTSIAATDAQELARSQRSDINKLQSDITLGRERDRDALYQAAAGIGLQQGDQQLRDQAGARDQYRMEQTAAYEARNAQMQNFSTLLNLLNQRSILN